MTELVELLTPPPPLLDAAKPIPRPARPRPVMIRRALGASIWAFFTPAGLPAVSGAANALVITKLAATIAALKVRIWFSIKL